MKEKKNNKNDFVDELSSMLPPDKVKKAKG